MRPTDFVTKSEAMAMMLTAVCMRPITNLQAQELTGKHALRMNWAEAWQKRVAWKYLQMSSIDIWDLSPNSCATRSEVFDFASIVLDYTWPNGECMSNICKSIDARSKKFMQNTALTNYVSIEDFLSDASDLDPPLNSAQNLDDFSTMLSDEYKIIWDITSFDELINSLELDPYLLGAKNLHELVEVLDEYESISDQIRALEWSDQEDVKDFLYELSFQNEFEWINSLWDLIESTQDLSNFEDILMPWDFLAAIELANTGIPFLDFVQSWWALGNLDEKYSDLPDIENISDLISHIDSYPGLNWISDEDELVAALTELPGFGEVDSVNDFLSIVDEIEGFDNFEDNFAAVMLMWEWATLEDALEGAKTANQFIETMKQHADFADDESIHDILGSLNDHVILQDVNDFIGLADVLRNYPEFSSAHSVWEVVGILEMYDRLIENAPGYSVFVNTNSPDSFINTVKKYAWFEHTKTIAEFISTLRSEFPEIFDQWEDDISLLLWEINRVLERIDPSDEDWDTLYNYQEDSDGNGNPADDDSDGDGIPNYLDTTE